MAVLLIRHAHAGDRSDWDGDDRERPLSPRGWRQATGLVAVLDQLLPTRVLASPYVRCRQTVEPLAQAVAVAVEPVEALMEGHSDAACRLVSGLRGDTVALCSHGDVIPDVLGAVVDRDDLALPGGPSIRCAKGSVWVLEGDGSRFVSATYLPPPTT